MAKKIETCRDDVERELARLGVKPSHYQITGTKLHLLGGRRAYEIDLTPGPLTGPNKHDQILAVVRCAAMGGAEAR